MASLHADVLSSEASVTKSESECLASSAVRAVGDKTPSNCLSEAAAAETERTLSCRGCLAREARQDSDCAAPANAKTADMMESSTLRAWRQKVQLELSAAAKRWVVRRARRLERENR